MAQEALHVYEPPTEGLPYLIVEFDSRGTPQVWRASSREQAEKRALAIGQGVQRPAENLTTFR